MKKGLGVVCSLASTLGKYLARLEVGFARLPRNNHQGMFVLLRKLLRTLGALTVSSRNPSNTTNPHRVFEENMEVGSPPYAITQENFHVSLLTSTPANGKLWQSIAADNRRLSERRSHVKTTGLR